MLPPDRWAGRTGEGDGNSLQNMESLRLLSLGSFPQIPSIQPGLALGEAQPVLWINGRDAG